MTRGPGQRTERKDGQVRREYGMNQTDGEDEEETDDEGSGRGQIFFSFLFYLILYGLCTYHTLLFFWNIFSLFSLSNIPFALLLGSFERGRV